MKLLRFAFIALAGLVLSPAYAAPAKDWSNTVTQTKEGAFVLGNPAAKNRLVEYVSYTCPHCAHFVGEASAPLKSNWVAKGIIAVEVRNLVRDRFDLTAALLARCGGGSKFFGNHETLFANQEKWVESAQAYRPNLPTTTTPAAAMTDLADKTGLIALLAKRGLTAAQARVCLSDKAQMDQVLAMTKRGMEQDGVEGTPSFLVNGKMTPAHDWASLRPLLPAPAN